MGILIAIVSMTGLTLFLPEDIATKLFINDFRKNLGSFVGPVFLFSASLLIARIFTFPINILVSYIRKKSKFKDAYKMLHELTGEEKEYLSEYVNKDKNSLIMPLEDGVIGGLEAKKIVYQASNMGYLGGAFAFNLQTWARVYLKKNKILLIGATNKLNNP